MVRSAAGTSSPDYSMTIACTPDEVGLTARGIATAVAPDGGLTEMQAALLSAVASALTNTAVDYRALEPGRAGEPAGRP